MSDQEALRQEIARVIDYDLFYVIGDIGLPPHGFDGPHVQRIANHLADAVLPVLQRRETELIEKWAHSLDHWGGAIKAVDWWMGEHAALVEKIEALAQDDDDTLFDVIEPALDVAHGRCDYGCCFSAFGYSEAAARAVKARLRPILPTQGDTE
jgi:hypothetical protein